MQLKFVLDSILKHLKKINNSQTTFWMTLTWGLTYKLNFLLAAILSLSSILSLSFFNTKNEQEETKLEKNKGGKNNNFKI